MGNTISNANFANFRTPTLPQGPGGFGGPQGPSELGGQQGPSALGGQQGLGGPSMFGPGGVGFSGQSSFQSANAAGSTGVNLDGASRQQPRLPPPELMKDLGEILKIRPEELASKLASGQSLTDVASSQGMSSDDLTSAITQLLGNRLPQLSDDQRSKMASGIVAGLPPPPPMQQIQ